MYNKVLVADDLGSITLGVKTVAESLGLKNLYQVNYCDDAYLKIKKGILDGDPFDLLITDLSFKQDHRVQKYSSGEELIKILRKENADLKIIVYSIEDRIQRVRTLINDYNINGYVCKGRKGLEDLSEALKATFENRLYLSDRVYPAISNKTILDIDEFDIYLLQNLSEGKSPDDISSNLKLKKISPHSKSTIEKRLNRLKTQFNANNVIHLVAITKDMGLI